MTNYSNNVVTEQAKIKALGKAKALITLLRYKTTSLKDLLKNQKISKKEYFDKLKNIKNEIRDNFYKLQSMVDPTTASTIDNMLKFVT